MIKTFHDLRVWQSAHQMVLTIYVLTKHFPTEEKFGLSTQIRRSASSICANIAEGQKKSTKDFVRFLEIAQGSLEETKYHILLGKDLKYLSQNEFTSLNSKCDEVGMMLSGLIRKLKMKS